MFPKAKITIVGCNDGVSSEKNNLDISRGRAETVKKYLTDIWGIEESRIKTEARNMPEKNSNPSTEDGIQENRRAEIYTDDPDILEPVLTTDTIRTVYVPNIRFLPTAQADAGLAAWKINVSNEGKHLRDFPGNTTLPPTVNWDLQKLNKNVLKNLTSVRYQLEVSDLIGQRAASSPDSVPVEQLTIEKKRDLQMADTLFARYNLILFDFGKSNLGKMNQKIAEFVRNRLTPIDIITVTGYADRIGSAEYNKKLSEARAKSTAAAIQRQEALQRGVGGSELLYDNDLPEGRFYCRTVEIFVVSPRK